MEIREGIVRWYSRRSDLIYPSLVSGTDSTSCFLFGDLKPLPVSSFSNNAKKRPVAAISNGLPG